jgi:hypothetical protein
MYGLTRQREAAFIEHRMLRVLDATLADKLLESLTGGKIVDARNMRNK